MYLKNNFFLTSLLVKSWIFFPWKILMPEHTNLRDFAASPVAMETEVHIVSLH